MYIYTHTVYKTYAEGATKLVADPYFVFYACIIIISPLGIAYRQM